MKIDSAQLLAAYEATRAFSTEDDSVTERFRPVEEIFEDKKAKADAVIMVYGVYNAGKSTLINALLGREEAATDDIPLTDKVSAYQWDQYSILDTPGVDAPIEHENVTNAQMLKADAIIFVVDPVGTAEEAKTLSVLMDLQQAGKQVFLVLNEKKPINEEDFIKLKDQTRERLQQMAAERGLRDVLKSIPIVRINAKRALQGQLKNQPKLVELSGYPAFEKQLREFLQSISPDDIYGRLKNQLVTFLKEYVAILNNRSKSEIVKNYDKMIRDISVEKVKLRQDMACELLRHKTSIYERSKSFMRSSPESCQTHIEKLLESAGKEVATHLNDKLQIFVNSVQSEIEELQAALPKIAHEGIPITAPKLETAASTSTQREFTEASGMNPALLNGAISQIVTLAKPEHIVSSLQLVKSALPSLMKGIGAKTMEKWATTALTKWIPYVGTIISAASILFDLFSGDSEEKQLRQQTEEQQRAKERALQQMEDFAREISSGFETTMHEIIQSELETFFANVLGQVDSLRQAFNDTERDNSQRLERLQEIQQIAASA
jgi:GTP-binding protein EngB required for normal cell division/gas vesicle protein